MNLLRDMKISVKLPLTISFALLLAIGAGFFGIHTLTQATKTYERVVGVDLAQEQMTSQLLIDLDIEQRDVACVLDPKRPGNDITDIGYAVIICVAELLNLLH